MNKICPFMSRPGWHLADPEDEKCYVKCLKEKCMAWRYKQLTNEGYCRLIEEKF